MRVIAWILFLCVAFILSCDDDRVTEQAPARDRPDEIRLDREAEEAALWLSGERLAPQSLYETIHADLAAIRAEYAGDIPVLNTLEFQPWWTTSRIGVYVTPELRDLVLAHQPNPLDSLNTAFHAASMGPFRFIVNGWRTIILFTGRQHPERLAEFYAATPGVVGAFADSWLGDFSNVYPWHVDGGMSYLFRHGQGDCMVGCDLNDFYYFRRVGGATEFVGSFRLFTDPYPEWWGEAKVPFCTFMTYLWNGFCVP